MCCPYLVLVTSLRTWSLSVSWCRSAHSTMFCMEKLVSTTATAMHFWVVVGVCLRCLVTVGWASGRASGLYIYEWWGAGICPERGADCLHMAQLMPLPTPKPNCLLPRLNPNWFYLSGTSLTHAPYACLTTDSWHTARSCLADKRELFMTHLYTRFLPRDAICYAFEPSNIFDMPYLGNGLR